MNDTYLYEYTDQLGYALSFAHLNKYSLGALEKAISYSSFFQKIEKGQTPIIEMGTLLKQLFPELLEFEESPIYSQCAWAAEAFLRIQKATRLTFEAIFLYVPIRKMYEFFYLYHEMDFSQIVGEFNALWKKKSILALAIKARGISLRDISKEIGIPYITLESLKERKRDIKKFNLEKAVALAALLNIRVETLAELPINSF